MSRNVKKITKALESKGWTPIEIEWEPIGGAAEMCGNSGGWYIEIVPLEGRFVPEACFQVDNTILAYNIQEVMDEINRLPRCLMNVSSQLNVIEENHIQTFEQRFSF